MPVLALSLGEGCTGMCRVTGVPHSIPAGPDGAFWHISPAGAFQRRQAEAEPGPAGNMRDSSKIFIGPQGWLAAAILGMQRAR